MGLFDFFKKKKQTVQITNKDRAKFAEDMKANANSLVNQFKDKVSLNFTIESLEDIDKIIEDNTDHYNSSGNETKQKMIISIGAYIFEVARLNFGGQYYWYDRLDQPILVTGQPEFEMSLLAYEKTKGRFENGIEDNIPFFFDGFVQGVKNKQSQMIV
ncbi:MAG: hypothetical protein LBV43_00290 [Prevotella sp.]|jgi:hypothetical protein|nr:hypothetical protein [Prevotella sp.]